METKLFGAQIANQADIPAGLGAARIEQGSAAWRILGGKAVCVLLVLLTTMDQSGCDSGLILQADRSDVFVPGQLLSCILWGQISTEDAGVRGDKRLDMQYLFFLQMLR